MLYYRINYFPIHNESLRLTILFIKPSREIPVLVTGRPDINIYPYDPMIKNIKITGLFLIDFDDPKNKKVSKSVTLLR